MLIHFGEISRISVSQDSFEKLPSHLKTALQGNCLSVENDDDELIYSIVDKSVADEIYSKFRKWEKNAYRSEHRRYSEKINSSGLYEKLDIVDLTEAQGNKCYYTGQQITNDPKNYSIDHIVPIKDGGSCWPKNLAICLKSANLEKHGMTKKEYFSILRRRYGIEWYNNKIEFCKSVDYVRNKIHLKRYKYSLKEIKNIERQLEEIFHDVDYLCYEINNDGHLVLSVDGIDVVFPRGFIRAKKKSHSPDFLAGILRAMLGQ